MRASTVAKCRTGDRCSTAGRYEFDGYLDASGGPRPAGGEMEIAMAVGDSFPPIASAAKPCYWRLTELDESEMGEFGEIDIGGG